MATTDELKGAVATFWKTLPSDLLFRIGATPIDIFGRSLYSIGENVIDAPKAIADAIRKTDEAAASLLNQAGAGYLVSIGLPREVGQKFIEGVGGISPQIAPLRTLWALLAHLGLVTQFIRITADSSAPFIRRAFAKQFTPERLSLSDALSYNLRTTGDMLAGLDLAEYGFDAEHAKQLVTVTQSILGVSDTLELSRRGIITPEQAESFLNAQGFVTKEIRDLVIEGGKPLLDKAAADELLRRGLLTEEEWRARVSRFGYSEDTVSLLRPLLGRLLDATSAFRLFHQKRETKDETMSRLAALGFTPADSEKMIALSFSIPSVASVLDAWQRGRLTDEQALSGLTDNALSEENAKTVMALAWRTPDLGTIFRYVDRGLLGRSSPYAPASGEVLPDEALKQARAAGYDAAEAQRAYRLHFTAPGVSEVRDMANRGLLPEEQLPEIFRTLGFDTFWADRLAKASAERIPRRSLSNLWNKGILDSAGILQRLRAYGFNAEDAQLMFLEIATEQADAQKTLTKADLVGAFVSGDLDETALRRYLVELNYTKEAVDWYVSDAKLKRSLEQQKDSAQEDAKHIAEAQDLSKTEILDAYGVGMLSRAEAGSYLAAVGYSGKAIAFILALADLQKRRAELERVSETARKLWWADSITIEDARKRMLEAGLSPSDVRARLDTWQTERKIATAQSAKKLRMPTQSDVDKWLTKGIIDVDRWREYMDSFGYDEEATRYYLIELVLSWEK